MTSGQEPVLPPKTAIKAILTRPIAFHTVLARICGSVTAGLMLSQALYWTDVQERTNPEAEGWFYKTQDEWKEEICLSRHEQDSARKVLVNLGFLRTELRGVPARLYYLITDHFYEAIFQFAGNRQTRLPQTSKQDCGKTSKQDCRKPANKSAENQQAFNKETETTSETTTETTSVSTPDGASLSIRTALKEWLAAKERLKEILPPKEWALWVRPAYLLSVMSGGTLQIALPPNGRIIKAAKARVQEISRLLGRVVVFTKYPDEYERERMKREYPEIYAQWFGTKDGR